MPIRITNRLRGTIESRVDSFRRTFPRGSGYSIAELAALPEVGGSYSQIAAVIARRRWGILYQRGEGHRTALILLVNPKDLKKYADESEPETPAAR